MRRLGIQILTTLVIVLMAAAFFLRNAFTLDRVEQFIQRQYHVAEISPAVLNRVLEHGAGDYLIFDIRQPEEYEVGHIQNAIRVNPDMPAQAFERTFGENIRDKYLIFYCSVGFRSSVFVERVEIAALFHGAHSLASLRGGLFRWYKEGFPIYNAHGRTDKIHPFNVFWGLLLRQDNR